MRLYLVLLPFFFLSQNNLWSWQSSSTMTKQEIEAQLALKNQALEALLKKYNLSIKTALTAEQLAILKKAHAILGIAETPQDIGKKTFIAYVQDWVQDFINTLDEERRTDLQINVPSIITSLRERIKKSNFPISTILWKTLKQEINKLSSPTTAEGLRGALLKGFHAFKTEMETKFPLTQHFKKNNAIYRKIKKKNLNELVMTASDFETWLKGLLEVAEKEQRERERELEKEQRELKSKYALYLDNYTIVLGRELNAIKVSNPTSLSDTLNMDMKALFRNLSAALDSDRSRQAPLGKDLWAYANKNFSSQPYYEMEDVRELFNTWCKNLSSKSPWYEEQFEFWKKHKEGFPNPSLIAAAINNAYIDINADTIRQHLVEWTKSVKDAFVLSKNYTIILQNAQKHFKELFEEQSNKGMSTLFFYADILEPLLQQHGAKATLEQLKNTVWEKALLQVVDQQRIANYFGEWRVDYGPYVVKAFNEELDTLLPSTEEIRQALLKSVERKRELLLPTIEVDSLKMDLIIRSPKLDQLEIKKKLLVHLAYENYPNTQNGRLTDFLTVVPTALLVGDGNSEASKSKIEVVQTNIKKTAIYPNGSASTSVKITFMAVTDVEKLFDSINTKDLNYKGQDLSGLLKKISVEGSVKGVGVKMGVEDVIYKSTNVEYFEVEFIVGSIVIEGKDKVIELQTIVNCKDHNFKVTFADGSTFLGGQTFLRPKYDYK